MGKIIMITSGKGGCGVSSAGLVFAVSSAEAGRRVLLVDGDAGCRTQDYLAATEELLLYDLTDAAAGRCPLPRVWYASPAYEGLWVMPAPLCPQEAPAPEQAAALLRECACYFDEVVVDVPARSPWLPAVAGAAQEVAVCTMADPLSVRACGLLRERLAEVFSGEARLIISRFDAEETLAVCGSADLDSVIDGVGLRLLGVVPWDDTFARYTMARDLRGKQTDAWAALSRCAARLHGETIPLCEKNFV